MTAVVAPGPAEDSLSAFQINFQRDYRVVKELGSGAFGSVKLVKHRVTKHLYAAKLIPTADMTKADRIALQREAQLLAHTNHPALLCLRGYGNDSSTRSAVILTDYMPHGSVATVAKDSPGEWTPTRRFIAVVGVAAGMQYLHNIEVIHRDLKPANIFLNPRYEPVIGDFGFAKAQDATQQGLLMSMVGGTPLYMGPELCTGSAKYDSKVDVYAFAVYAYEVLTGKEPFRESRSTEDLKRRVSSGVRPDVSSLSGPLQELITKCWEDKPKSRPTFDKIVEYFLTTDCEYPGIDKQEVDAYIRKVLPTAFLFHSLERVLSDVAALRNEVQALRAENEELKARLSVPVPSPRRSRSKDFSIGETGVMQYLSERGRRLIFSRSSSDPYSLLSANPSETYTTASGSPDNWIQFEFTEPFPLTEIKMRSGPDHHLKNWRLIYLGAHGDVLEYEFDSEDQFRNTAEPFCYQFQSVIRTTRVRIEQAGPCWNGEPEFCFATVDFGCRGDEFKPSLFRALDERGGTASQFVTVTTNDCAEIFNPDNRYTVRAYAKPTPAWLQVELEGTLLVTGYTFKRTSKRSNYILRGTNNVQAKITDWEEIDGKREIMDDLMVTVRCRAAESYSFFRLVLEGSQRPSFAISHWELFGTWNPRE
jgi:serine/threonine protein kinase